MIEEDIKNKLSLTKLGQDWLEQFDIIDRPLASELLDSIVWVSENELKFKLEDKIKSVANSVTGNVAIYLEREIRKNRYGVQRFYKQDNKPRRAFGAALQPIESTKRYNDEVGSEGVIGTLVTSIVRRNKSKFLFHPTAEDIRKKKVRKFILLTDTIGSGDQISKCLDSLWKVASIKSWKSSNLISFNIISYTITDMANKILNGHKTNPSIDYIIPCPTVYNQFEDDRKRQRIINLCVDYAKKSRLSKSIPPLGYSNTGALIAYGHGLPNNSPIIFYKNSNRWFPIFPGRVTNDIGRELQPGMRVIQHKELLNRWHKEKLAASTWLESSDFDAKNLVILMASLYRPPRSENAISARTQLDLEYVEKLLDVAKHHQWVSTSNRLTDQGKLLLDKLERKKVDKTIVFDKPDDLYFPSTLREPY
ncbi:hypothetical protein H3N34_03305 [Photobacterium damselae subsp. damselae]|uniref:phosphoribosyltransferase-like protein n=1 Tax=Photobacterium damselae TaxID=38293 RepID=UPI0015F44564|nr:hypothetical protein [Photobacterium damselae]MBA5682245.1 hypothetical protein [Photobacterium damselae subsp. damselae]